MLKKILFFVCVSAVGWANTYEMHVGNPTMLDAYFNIFNAFAALFSSGDYLNLLRLVFLAGGFFTFSLGVMKTLHQSQALSAPADFIKYMLVGTSLLIIIFSKTGTIVVKSDQIPTYCQEDSNASTSVQISNIPDVVGWTFSAINKFGVYTTKLAAEAFSNVDGSTKTYDTPYASYLTGIGNILSTKISDFAANTKYTDNGSITVGDATTIIANNCVIVPAAQDSSNGPAVINGLKHTGYIEQTLDDLLTKNKLNVYKNPTTNEIVYSIDNITLNGTPPTDLLVTINGETYKCEDAWKTLKNKLDAIKNSKAVECSSKLIDNWNPVTAYILTGQPPTSNTLGIGREIAFNAGLMNTLYDTKRNMAIGEISYATGKTMASAVHKYIGTGYYMAHMLPYFQMGIRAVLYAFFPFIFIVILLPGGMSVLANYLKSLIWVELWTPIAALLNMFVSIISQQKFADMYNNQGMNIFNGVQTFSDAFALAGMAGYLYTMVPGIAWMILKSSSWMVHGMGSKLAADLESNLNSDQINEDISRIQSNKQINERRLQKGMQTISLAEQDRMAAGFTASTQAGKWLGEYDQRKNLQDAARGDTEYKTLEGKGEFNAFESQDVKTALMAKTEQDVLTTKQVVQDLGLMDKDQINEDNFEKLTQNLGGSEASRQQSSANYFQDLKKSFMKKDDREAVQEIATYKGLDQASHVMEYKAFMDYQTKTHSGMTGKTVEDKTRKVAMRAAQTEGLERGNHVLKTEAELKGAAGLKTGSKTHDVKTDKYGNMIMHQDNYNNLARYSTALGKNDLAKDLATERTVNTFGVSKIRDTEFTQQIEKIGTDTALKDIQNKQITTLAKDGDKKAQELLKKKQTPRNLADMVGYTSIVGAEGEVFNNAVKDKKSEQLVSMGEGSAPAIVEVTNTAGEYQKMKASYKELLKSKEGREIVEQVKKELNIKGDNLTDGEQMLVAQIALNRLKSVTDSYNAIKEHSNVNTKLNYGLTAEKEGNVNAFQQATMFHQTQILQDIFKDPEQYAKLKVFGALLKNISTIIHSAQELGMTYKGMKDLYKYLKSEKFRQQLKTIINNSNSKQITQAVQQLKNIKNTNASVIKNLMVDGAKSIKNVSKFVVAEAPEFVGSFFLFDAAAGVIISAVENYKTLEKDPTKFTDKFVADMAKNMTAVQAMENAIVKASNLDMHQGLRSAITLATHIPSKIEKGETGVIGEIFKDSTRSIEIKRDGKDNYSLIIKDNDQVIVQKTNFTDKDFVKDKIATKWANLRTGGLDKFISNVFDIVEKKDLNDLDRQNKLNEEIEYLSDISHADLHSVEYLWINVSKDVANITNTVKDLFK